MNRKIKRVVLPVIGTIIALLVWFFAVDTGPQYSDSVMNVPAFSGEPYVVINNNEPEFSHKDMTSDAYEFYSPLDHQGRCGYAMACLGVELMPEQERQSISSVKPSGWVQVQYDFVDGQNLYNRCHLIGFQLSGENANEKNLITGTRYMNVEGMLPFENMVADYIKETGNHVLYRVTPVFHDRELVARGVQLEARSTEDAGEGICFNVYVYNNQPGVDIDYSTGKSTVVNNQTDNGLAEQDTYILNTGSGKFHKMTCDQGKAIKESNKKVVSGRRDEMIHNGYDPAGCCDP